MTMLRRFAAIASLLCLSSAATAQSPEPRAIWVNDYAQFVIDSIDADGKLAGTYTNYGRGFGCADRPFPVIGWIDGNMISFTVLRRNPANCTPIQSWTGVVRDGQLLVEYIALKSDGGQTSLFKGSDTYRRQTSERHD